MRWNPMKSAPRDGAALLELRHVSKEWGECVFRARWLASRKVWVDWDRQEVTLDKAPLKGWRLCEFQPPQWTEEELNLLNEIHGPSTIQYLPAHGHYVSPIEQLKGIALK